VFGAPHRQKAFPFGQAGSRRAFAGRFPVKKTGRASTTALSLAQKNRFKRLYIVQKQWKAFFLKILTADKPAIYLGF